ncbi:MAG: PEP-CTERM sorting domain-containing protein [Verrucomicrobia bacterium]|nr:PEP-CTERM sorting domain-containing protein [Verrucomicrobiota bacterium]
MRSLSLKFLAAGLASVLCAGSASAAFHLWNIRELYTNASGTLQYIEFFTTFGSQQFVSGQQISITNGVTTNSFTIPSNLPGDSANHAFIIGTAGLQAAGGPIPDFIIPNNFLFAGGGTITFFGSNGGSYSALPTNGTQSYSYPSGTVGTNSPQNFAGAVGVVPEPTTWAFLLAAGGLATARLLRRRSA